MQKMRLLLFLAIILLITTIVSAKILVYEDEKNQCPIIILKQQTSAPGQEPQPAIPEGQVCCNTHEGDYAILYSSRCTEIGGNYVSEVMCAQVCCQRKARGMKLSTWYPNTLAGNCRNEGSTSHPSAMCEPTCCKFNTDEGPLWQENIAGNVPISVGGCQEMSGEVLPEEACNDICCAYKSEKTGLQILNVLGPTACNRKGGEKVDLPVEACESYGGEIQPGLADISVCCKIQDNGPGQNTRHQILPSKECKNLGKFGGTTTEIAPKEACESRDSWRVSNKRFCFFNPEDYDASEPSINSPQGLVFAGESIRYSFKGPPEEAKCFTCRFNEQTQLGYFEETNCNQRLKGYNWNEGNVNAGDDSYSFGIPNACIFGPSITGEQGSTSVTINLDESVRYTYTDVNKDKECFTCAYPESGNWVPELRSVDCSQISRAYDLSAERMEGITPEGLRGSYSPITGQVVRSIGTNTGGFFAKIVAFFSSIFG